MIPSYRPLYEKLSQAGPAGDVAWNFEKFLVGRDGRVIARFKSRVEPDDPALVEAIERALDAPPREDAG
ncbi:MAG: hypothetical protein M1546_00760 [Chloroflexi bacterium]|nr:hypothetical protein [Chloroflexota bacterium]